jgi:hypothetical protein
MNVRAVSIRKSCLDCDQIGGEIASRGIEILITGDSFRDVIPTTIGARTYFAVEAPHLSSLLDLNTPYDYFERGYASYLVRHSASKSNPFHQDNL